MATIAIWKVSSRLDHVLDYVMSIEKTEIYAELRHLSDSICQ